MISILKKHWLLPFIMTGQSHTSTDCRRNIIKLLRVTRIVRIRQRKKKTFERKTHIIRKYVMYVTRSRYSMVFRLSVKYVMLIQSGKNFFQFIGLVSLINYSHMRLFKIKSIQSGFNYSSLHPIRSAVLTGLTRRRRRVVYV